MEAIRILGLENKTRFYQASTSELYGKVQEIPQTESTPFYPRSPYAVAKLYAYWITVNYREAYNMFACNGILFNHESPIRGETFVTRKITRAAANIALGYQKHLFLGNLESKRDWGHAKDYVEAMWLMLQHDAPEDFVIATGIATSVKEFCSRTFSYFGINLAFSGVGKDEIAVIDNIDKQLFEEKIGIMPKHLNNGDKIIQVDPFYFRPTEVDLLMGDARKAKLKLGWEPRYDLNALISEMIKHDIHNMKKDMYLRAGGFNVSQQIEDVL